MFSSFLFVPTTLICIQSYKCILQFSVLLVNLFYSSIKLTHKYFLNIENVLFLVPIFRSVSETRHREHTHTAFRGSVDCSCHPTNRHYRKGELQLDSTECRCQNLKPNIGSLYPETTFLSFWPHCPASGTLVP